jgi:hypothetical protein
MIRAAMPTVATSKVIYASTHDVWNIVTDTVQWVRWGPSIRAVACPERYIRPGSKGRVQTALGFWLPFEVTDYVHERYWSWRVLGIHATGHTVMPLGEDMCRLTFEAPVFALPYVGICALAVRRIARIAELE